MIFERSSSNLIFVDKIKNSKTKLVMFDFDGTLVDTAPDIVAATNLLLTKYGHQALPEEVIRRDIGTGLKTLLKDFFPEAHESEAIEAGLMEEFLLIYRNQYLKSPKPFDGVLDFLSRTVPELGLKIAIVSNKSEALISPILKELQMNQFPWVRIIGGDTFEHMKPHPLPLEMAMRAAGVSAEESVLVGDGTPDIEGALAAGCRSIAVSFGYTPLQTLLSLGAHRYIHHYRELSDLL